MIITVSIPLVAAICYTGMLAAASASDQAMTHDILFVDSMFEIMGNLAISMVRKYKVVSFEGSHLAERLNLLTLIILGEGESQTWTERFARKQTIMANISFKESSSLPKTFRPSKLH